MEINNLNTILKAIEEETGATVKELKKHMYKDELIENLCDPIIYVKSDKLNFYNHQYELSFSFSSIDDYELGTVSFIFSEIKDAELTTKLIEKFQEIIKDDVMADLPAEDDLLTLTFETIGKFVDPVKFIKECFSEMKMPKAQDALKDVLKSLD